jgi:hypothetical protein
MRARPCLAGLPAVLCVLLAWTPAGHANEDSKKVCASAFASAQRLMRSGNLIEAKTKLIQCGGLECPVAMNPDCQQWLSSVEASIATIVFEVFSADGQPASEVTMAVDGGDPIVLDGRAVSVNPGPHDITFEAAAAAPTKKHVVVSEGEKLRRETVRLDPLPASRLRSTPVGPGIGQSQSENSPSRATRLTTPVVIAASGAALAGASALYFGLKARSDDRNLDGCAPASSCSREATDQVRREYLWTNLSIGLAAASATTAIVLFLIHDRSTTPTNSTTSPNTTLSIRLRLGPDGFGPVATGTF